MSEFLNKVNRLAAMLQKSKLTPQQKAQADVGTVFAEQFIDALRNGGQPPNLLFCAVTMVCSLDENLSAGFFRELQDELARGGRS